MTESALSRLQDALARAEAHSPYLRQLLNRHTDVTNLLSSGDLDGAIAACEIVTDEPTSVAMRKAKGRLALALGIGDLAGLLPLETVVTKLSVLADDTLSRSIAQAITDHVPGSEPRGFAAIALGKHGSCELNYSSDIDPIFIYDPETLPHRPREEVEEAAVRIGRKVVELMQARTEHGYVFRVDLRLRPSPEVTPIVLPVEAAISYYESSALPWERAAFIRSRACSGDIALGQYFLDAIRPFVWRRGLDFGAIKEIRGMSHRIRDHYSRGQVLGPGFDLKSGRGGIRECEFFAQIHQMIHGGRNPALRTPATMDALSALADAGHIGRDEAEVLSGSYRLYRTIEHRLQMVDDQQTHSLPKSAEALDSVSRLHGLNDGSALIALLEPNITSVGEIYDGLEADADDQLPSSEALLADVIAKSGVGEADILAQRISQWRSGTARALRTPVAQEALESILPKLVAAFAKAPDATAAINRLDMMIDRLPSALNLFRLLEARPLLLDMMMDVLCLAPTLAADLSRRPDLLDGLIDATALRLPPEIDAIAERLRHDDPEADLEQRLDKVRREVGEMRFALGVQIVEGTSDPVDVAAGYARVAEAAIRVVTDAVTTEYEAIHGRVPDSELIILALGRMGGAELTHASDLDLIYLFSGEYGAESDGRKPLGAVHYYNRLGQRVTAGLSVPTAAGALYEVDTRLRPSGADGPLAVSLDGFELYQHDDAWTWEHLALVRARPVYGSDAVRAATQEIISKTLRRDRDWAAFLSDAVTMRGEIAKAKPPKGELDVKLIEGGLVDLEFAVQVRQFRNPEAFDPRLAKSIEALIAGGHAPETLARDHALLTRFLVTLRLVAPELEDPAPASKALIARACCMENWEQLLEQYAATRQRVRQFWRETAGQSQGE